MSEIPYDSYLRHAFNLKPKEVRLRDEFEKWLPDRIIDAHSHSNDEASVGDLPGLIRERPLSTFPVFTLDNSREANSLFHPSKKIYPIRFPQPYKGIDHRLANQYLLSSSSKKVVVCGIPDDVEYTTKMLHRSQVCGLKMYYLYYVPPVERVYDYFPKELLKVCEKVNKPIVLHPPSPVPDCIDQLETLLSDFPDLRVIIAHLGLYSEPIRRFEKAYQIIGSYSNIYTDTSMNPSADLFDLALRHIGEDRVLYGSDQPISLIRSVQYDHPDLGTRMMPDYKYHWVQDDEWENYHHLGEGSTHSHWQSLLAIRSVIDDYPKESRSRIKRKVFFQNALSVFNLDD